MALVSNETTIDGPIERVFDLVTTTRYWPQWHPATTGVDGVVDRPVALGDVVRERARIGAQDYEGDWTVAEHERPTRVLLRGESGRIQIAYTFTAQGPALTHFRRELEFEPEDFRASVADPDVLVGLMHRQSEDALRKLKALVEEQVRSA